MPDRHRIEVDHEAAAAQQKEACERNDERLDLAEVDDKALQSAEQKAEAQHHSTRNKRMPAHHVEVRHHHAHETDHRSDRQVDAAGENDEGRADRGDDDESVVGQDIAEYQSRQKILVENPSGYEQRGENDDRGEKRQVLLVHRLLQSRLLDNAARRLSDCNSRTMTTTTALTTRLYSGGKPLVRMEVVSA